MPKHRIALQADNSPDLTRGVVVVNRDAPPLTKCFTATSTPVVMYGQQSLELFIRQPILPNTMLNLIQGL